MSSSTKYNITWTCNLYILCWSRVELVKLIISDFNRINQQTLTHTIAQEYNRTPAEFTHNWFSSLLLYRNEWISQSEKRNYMKSWVSIQSPRNLVTLSFSSLYIYSRKMNWKFGKNFCKKLRKISVSPQGGGRSNPRLKTALQSAIKPGSNSSPLTSTHQTLRKIHAP